jgi:hypothetical protein
MLAQLSHVAEKTQKGGYGAIAFCDNGDRSVDCSVFC